MKINWFKLALFCIIAIFVWRIFFSSPQKDPLQSEELIVGTNAEFAPFCFIKDNEIVGFDIDVAKEVAKRLGKIPKFKNMDFEMLIPEMQIGGVHMLAAGMTATKERAARVLFTEPYIKDVVLMVVTLKDKPIEKPGIEGLKGKTVVVNDGYTADLYLSGEKDIKLKRLATVTEAFMDLRTGQSDAYVSAKNALNPYFNQWGRENFNLVPIEGTDENCALAVSKHYSSLLPEVQAVLNAMEEDGTLTKLKTKWNLL